MTYTTKTVLENITPLLDKLRKKLQMLKKKEVLTELKETNQNKKLIRKRIHPKRITYINAHLFIGKIIKFNTKDGSEYGILKKVSKSGKSIHIIHKNNKRILENVHRRIFVCNP